MPDPLTANQVIQRIQTNLGVSWKAATKDKLASGAPETAITGIATSFSPTVDVLRKAVARGQNMVIVRESPFWVHELYGRGLDGPATDMLMRNSTYRAKQEIIARHGLVILQFAENWDARRTDGQVRGLAKALGWDQYLQSNAGATRERYTAGDVYFRLPATTLGGLATAIQAKLKLQGIRVIGAPEAATTKVALMPGFTRVADVGKVLREPGVDVIVAGEPVEWEAAPYFQDVIAAGRGKGMILLGQVASADPGSGEVAAWLRTFIPEVPVDWIPAGEPFWIPDHSKETHS